MVELDHLLIPSRDKAAAAALLARLFDVPQGAASAGPFEAVYLNPGLTLDFDDWPDPIPQGHYCFRVSETEFDLILGRLQTADIPHRSSPHGPQDGQVLHHLGGRVLYWNVPDGHMWELLTVSYARQTETGKSKA